MYSAVPTPSKISRMVKVFPTALSGRTSRKPTVVIVVTVWYSASRTLKPSAT